MDELEQLRRENARLDAEEEVRQNMDARQREKNTLKRKIWAKKNPRVVKVVKVAKRSAGGVGMIFGMAGRAVAPVIKQGAMNFANNAQEQMKDQLQEKRVVKVKKVKRKSKPKKRRVVRKRSPFDFFN